MAPAVLWTSVSDPPVSLRDPTPNRLAALPRGSVPGAGWRRWVGAARTSDWDGDV